MRLVCPNCEAKYEVPEDAIPDTGRDVQCANCGHAWFQMRPRPPSTSSEVPPAAASAPAPMAEAPAATIAEPPPPVEPTAAEAPTEPVTAAAPDEVPLTETTGAEGTDSVAGETAAPDTAPAPAAEQEPESAAETARQDDSIAAADTDGSDTDEPDSQTPAPAAAAQTAPYAGDESVLAILREEAEREAQARAAEARALETQPDLGIDAAIPDRKAASATPATPPAPQADDGIEGELKPSARRDLLPDVEEINSTLRPSELVQETSDGPLSPEVRNSGGFRGGFLTVMVVSILAAAVYVTAPTLSRMVPSSAGTLTAYVGAVDSLRLSLDGLMRSATVAINGE